MKKKYKNICIDDIIDNIDIDNNLNIREIYDEAINFEFGEEQMCIGENNLQRLLVNNIRHNHSNYEPNLKRVYRIDNGKHYAMYKNEVLDSISNQYPYLENACNKQKRKIIVVKKRST